MLPRLLTNGVMITFHIDLTMAITSMNCIISILVHDPNIKSLKNLITKKLSGGSSVSSFILTSKRQVENIGRAKEHMELALKGLSTETSLELVVEDSDGDTVVFAVGALGHHFVDHLNGKNHYMFLWQYVNVHLWYGSFWGNNN